MSNEYETCKEYLINSDRDFLLDYIGRNSFIQFVRTNNDSHGGPAKYRIFVAYSNGLGFSGASIKEITWEVANVCGLSTYTDDISDYVLCTDLFATPHKMAQRITDALYPELAADGICLNFRA